MKILKLTAENIKKLKVVEIEPHGNVGVYMEDGEVVAVNE